MCDKTPEEGPAGSLSLLWAPLAAWGHKLVALGVPSPPASDLQRGSHGRLGWHWDPWMVLGPWGNLGTPQTPARGSH